MTAYNRGDAILVDIAFSGAIGYKPRPAVVMSTRGFNHAGILTAAELAAVEHGIAGILGFSMFPQPPGP